MFKKLSVLLAVLGIAFIINACKENSVTTLPIEAKNFEFLQNVEVGSQPAEIFYDEETHLFNIFCLGVDLNYNNIKDAGDENPSWWVIDKNNITKATKVMDFDFGTIGFPFRPFIDYNNRYILLSQNEKIKKYNLDDYSLMSDNIADFKASAIYKNNDILFLSISTGYTTPGYLIAYDTKTRTVLDSIEAGINVQQILNYQKNGKSQMVILSEGMGNNDALLQFVEFINGKFNLIKKIDSIGNFANKMTISKNLLAVTLNGSNKILLINLDNFSKISDFDTQTTGYDGPREAVFDGFGNIYVTTYSGDIRKFDYTNGELIEILSVDSKAEGVSIIPNELMLVCNISKPDYSVNNLVSVFRTK